MKKIISLFTALVLAAGLCACQKQDEVAGLDIPDDIRDNFISGAPPEQYVYYAATQSLPLTWDDLLEKGMMTSCKLPQTFFPEKITNIINSSTFMAGSIMDFDEGSEGMDRFGGVPITVYMDIAKPTCLEALLSGEHCIMLAERNDPDLDTSKLTEIVFE